ncbi:hypothetical protein BJX61DRAFT_543493 [Aspergillus egyptiacus]|nr:hypothetical protein BJX61DRAFT_543493 [Aspergillus egyptiacus]
MDGLPHELLYLIINHLDTPSRAALARTSRRYYGIALPHVYTNISIRNNRVWTIRYPSFVQAIAQRPELGAAVQSLSLTAWAIEDDAERAAGRGREPYMARCNIDLFKELVREQPELFGQPEMWDRALEARNMDAFLAVILPRLTNLKSLAIEYFYHGTGTLFEKVVERGAERGLLFPRLEQVYITWYDTENGVITDKAIPFFSFPAMRRVGGGQVKKSCRDHSRNPKAVCISGVTEFDLLQSNCNGLIEWIELCRELKSFRLVYGGAAVSFDRYAPVSFRDELALHKTSLEKLWIEPDENGFRGEAEWIGSWVDYTKLRVLCLRLATLVELDEEEKPLRELGDLVPASLECLALLECGEEEWIWLPGQIEGMIINGRTPRLNALIIGGYRPERLSQATEAFKKVRQLCEEANISLKWDMDYLYEIWPANVGRGR